MMIETSKEEKKTLVYKGTDVVIYEDGWWMKITDYWKVTKEPFRWGIDKNDRTKQLILFAMF